METKIIKNEEEIENTIRSDEVEEIMENMPQRLIKWGSGAVVFLILILIGLSAIIQYPDTINGAALLTTKKPPIGIASKNTGIIEKIFVTDKAEVKAESILAVLKSRTDYNTVLWMDSLIFSSKVAGTTSQGKSIFDSIPTNIMDYGFWIAHQNKFNQLGDITFTFSSFLSSLRDFDAANTKNISIETALQGNAEKKICDKAWEAIMQLERVKAAILLWKERYLLTSPTDGKVSFQTPRIENQELKTGEEFCKIISTDKEIICKILIPIEGSAKVAPGQKVRIVLASYPENEFGFLEGEVQKISSIPLTTENSDNFVVTVHVQQPLISSIKKEIHYLPEMQASAEIITEKKTILTRITDILANYWRKSR